MSTLSIEQAIADAQPITPCKHDFVNGVCRKCFCPESPKYLDKAWELMRLEKLGVK